MQKDLGAWCALPMLDPGKLRLSYSEEVRELCLGNVKTSQFADSSADRSSIELSASFSLPHKGLDSEYQMVYSIPARKRTESTLPLPIPNMGTGQRPRAVFQVELIKREAEELMAQQLP
jgi:hypothetical protein